MTREMILLALALTTPGTSAAQLQWETIAPGVAWSTRTTRLAGREVNMQAVRVEPRGVHVHIAGTYQTLNARPGAYAYNLDELTARLQPLAIINGGPSASLSLPSPAGLLRIRGETLMRLRTGSALSGLFCINAVGTWSILPLSSYSDRACHSALQAGPLVIEADQNTINTTEPQRVRAAERSILCIDRRGRLLLVRTTVVSLYHLGNLLAESESAGGYACRSALNLSGSATSGIFIRRPRGQGRYGFDRSPIASAIYVVPNR